MDDVLRKVRKAREAYAKEFGYDLQVIHRDLKAQELAGGRRIVALPSRRPKPTVAMGEVREHRKRLAASTAEADRRQHPGLLARS